MAGTCSVCDQQCTFKDPPKNPGEIFGFPCDWCKLIKCKNCAKISANEVRAIATLSRSIPYICKDCAPKLKSLFDMEARVSSLEQQIILVKEETKYMSDFLENLKSLSEDINSIKDSLKSSFNELKTEICAVKTTNIQQHPPPLDSLPSMPPSMNSFMSEINDRALRANNIMVYNVPESNCDRIHDKIQEDRQRITEMLVSLNKQPASERMKKVVRVGKRGDNHIRPIKVVFSDSTIVKEILKSGKNFSESHVYKIKSDLTLMQRECIKKLISELNKRKQEGEDNLTIKYKDNVPYIATTISSTRSEGRKNLN